MSGIKHIFIFSLLLCTFSVNSRAEHLSIAYTWASQESSASYQPNASFTVADGSTSVLRMAVGRYEVKLGNITATRGGNVQVTSYGVNSTRCNIEKWNWNARILVNCFDSVGNYADSKFTVLFNKAIGSPGNSSFVWADRPTARNYTPHPVFTSNIEDVRIDRLSAGYYSVKLGSIVSPGGNVQVTSYGPNSNYCNVVNWYGHSVNVQCFNSAGHKADSKFTLLFTRSSSGVDEEVAYAWADKPAVSEYTPNTNYSINSAEFEIKRVRIGKYTIKFGDIFSAGIQNLQVTATGYGNNHCKVDSWRNDTATVRCFSPEGHPKDQRFSILASLAFNRHIGTANVERTVTVNVIALQATSTDSCNEKMDFYGSIEVGGGTNWRSGAPHVQYREFPVTEGNNISVNWRVHATMQMGEGSRSARAIIRIFDQDDFFCGGDDDIVDVNPTDRAELDFIIDLPSGFISNTKARPENPATFEGGDLIGRIGTIIRVGGSDRRDGREFGKIDFFVNIR